MRMQLADFRGTQGAGPTELVQPRVLICIPTLGGGGAERQIRLLARPLVERGIHLSLFSRLTDADAASMTEAGIRCFSLEARGNHNPRLLLELFRAVRLTDADLVHTFLSQMDILGGIAALTLRKPWLLSERSSPLAYPRSGKSRLRAWLGRRADAVVANSAYGLEVWPNHPTHHVIANGIDLAAIERAPIDFLAGREALRGRTVIVSVARLSAEKRLERLIGAVQRVKRAIPDLLLVLAGSGPEEESLRAHAAALGVQDHVLFAGFRSDVWSWLKHASVFVSPSLFEGQPNAVLEAAAAGIPQVLSAIPMHRHAVGNEGALFVSPDDEEQLAIAILSHLKDPAAARRIAAAARKEVEMLSIDRSADQLAKLYRGILAPRRACADQAEACDRASGS